MNYTCPGYKLFMEIYTLFTCTSISTNSHYQSKTNSNIYDTGLYILHFKHHSAIQLIHHKEVVIIYIYRSPKM